MWLSQSTNEVRTAELCSNGIASVDSAAPARALTRHTAAGRPARTLEVCAPITVEVAARPAVHPQYAYAAHQARIRLHAFVLRRSPHPLPPLAHGYLDQRVDTSLHRHTSFRPANTASFGQHVCMLP